MSFDWSEYLNLARELAGQAATPSTQEAKLRSAISRAYYAAFIKARNFLRERENLTIPSENAHQYVINQFRTSPDPRRIKLGRRLARFRALRNQADYNDTVDQLDINSQEALNLARLIISRIDSL